jgi:release factor glutamine methyltransferase
VNHFVAEGNPPPQDAEGLAPGRLADWLDWAAGTLAALGEGKLDAEVLAMHLLGCNRASLILRAEEALPAQLALRYAGLVERRRLGEPVAYLTGRREFWSLELEVTPAVLIPRPETELLVEWALEHLRALPSQAVADLGTGSGAIGLALAAERPDARVLATDASAEALEQARINARRLGLERVEFRLGEWCAPLAGERFDLIVSNPPYVAENDPHLLALRYEPRRALTSGVDGLEALRAIAVGASACLKPGGALLLEHGAAQGAAVRGLLEAQGYTDVATRRDLAGHERATGGKGL